ncbi:hypothetical protein EMCRGX_G015204 [Ephydatia muelleri]
MDGGQRFVFVGLLMLQVETFSPVCGCRDEVYQSDGLNVSTCDTQKLVLGWNINQKIFDIGLHYLCVNPSGVNVSTPSLNGFTVQVSSTTVTRVEASVGATCWFWACYRASSDSGLIYSVPSQSCVVQSLYTSTVILIRPSATSTDQIMPSSFMTYTSTASQMQTSLQTQLTPPNTQYGHWLPSPESSLATPYPSFTASYEKPTSFYTTAVLKTSCVSWWCSRTGYIAMSIAAPVVSILIILTVAAICRVMIRQRNVFKSRIHELHLIGYKINEKCDPTFTPATLTSLHVFKSVESQLDSLHQPSLTELEINVTMNDLHTDGYWAESDCTEGDLYQTDMSTSTYTISK